MINGAPCVGSRSAIFDIWDHCPPIAKFHEKLLQDRILQIDKRLRDLRYERKALKSKLLETKKVLNETRTD